MAASSFIKSKWKLIRKRFRHRAAMAIQYHVARREKKPVFLIATRRSGSNFFLGCLNSVPGISLATEILNPDMFYGIRNRCISKRAVLRHIRHSVNHGAAGIGGAKLLAIQMQAHGITTDDILLSFPNARFIVLYRESLLDQFVSLKIAEATGSWQWNEKPNPPKTIRVDPDDLMRYSHYQKSFYESLLGNPRMKHRTLTVKYEDFAEDVQRLFDDAVFPFVGVAPCPVSSAHRKQNICRPEDIVENYSTIKRFIPEEDLRQEYGAAECEMAGVP